MENIIRNFTHGFRLIAKSPGSTMLSALLLSVAIGMVSIVYTVLEGVIYQGLPYEESERLVDIRRLRADDNNRTSRWLFEDFKVLEAEQKSLEDLVPFFTDPVIVDYDGHKERISSAYVGPNFFRTLRAQPKLGRFFDESNIGPQAELTAVISYEMWEDEFNLDLEVIGKRILVDGIARTIIGVGDVGFDFPFGNQMWMPATVDTVRQYTGRGEDISSFGRLMDGVTYEQATDDITRITRQLASDRPETNEKYVSAEVRPFIENFVDGDGKRFWLMLFAITLFVLLMACANVSNIMMGKTIRRQNELAIRSALGASRSNLIAQLLTETLAVSILSIVGSFLFAEVYSNLLLNPLISDMNLPAWMATEVRLSYFVFVAFVSIVAVLIAGLAPAFRSTRSDIQSVLREGTRTGSSDSVSRFSRLLVVFQVSIAVVVLTGVALFMSSLIYETKQFQFYDTRNVVFGWANLDASNFPEPEDRFPIYETFRKEVEAHPAFSGLAFSNENSRRFRRVPVAVDGVEYPTDGDRPEWLVRIASPNYFKTMGIEVVEGREFTPEDTHGAPLVAMVMKKTADRIWPGESPLGKRIIIDRNATSVSDSSTEKQTLTIVGVFPDLWESEVYGFDPDGFARPLGQETWGSICLYAKGDGNFASLEQALRNIGNKVHSQFAVTRFQPMTEVVDQSNLFEFMVLKLVTSFGIAAIIMVGGGLYGVLSYAVSQRRQEFAIRSALGASSSRIVGMTFKQGGRQVLWGIGFGLIGGYAMHRVLEDIVNPFFPDYYNLVLLLGGLILIAAFAVVVPSWRASKVQPMEVLRTE